MHKYRHIFSFAKNNFYYWNSFNFADASTFQKNQHIFGKNSVFTHVSFVRNFLVLFSVSVKEKVATDENVSFTDHASRIWLLYCSKSAISCKNDNYVIILLHDLTVNCFLMFVNTITRSGVMTIFFYKRFTRNSKIGKTPDCVLSNI